MMMMMIDDGEEKEEENNWVWTTLLIVFMYIYVFVNIFFLLNFAGFEGSFMLPSFQILGYFSAINWSEFFFFFQNFHEIED